MVMVKNASREVQNFRVKSGDSSLQPGEVKDLDLANEKSAHNQGRILAGTIRVGDNAKPKKVKG